MYYEKFFYIKAFLSLNGYRKIIGGQFRTHTSCKIHALPEKCA